MVAPVATNPAPSGVPEYLGTLQHDGQEWYIQPPLAKVEGKRISLDEANGLYDWFHISPQEPDEHGQFRATPRVPKMPMSGEETRTRRICVGPSIHHCIAGLLGAGSLWDTNQEPDPDYPGHVLADMVREDPGTVHQFRGMHVYGVRRPKGLIEPSPEQVPDAPMTGEAWLTKPNVLEHVGQIQAPIVSGANVQGEEGWRPQFDPHLTKSIKDIPVGKFSSAPGPTGTWDYSHLLKPEQHQAGYRLYLQTDPDGSIKTALHDPQDKPTGGVVAVPVQNGKAITPHALTALPKKLRGQGFGRAMYEAIYAHAYKKLGIKKVDGGYHSAAARRVHESLARRHGLKYEPAPGFGNEEERRGGSYEYKLGKGELPLQKASIAETAAGRYLRRQKSQGNMLGALVYDYSHLLPKNLQSQYRLHVYDNTRGFGPRSPASGSLSVFVRHANQPVGELHSDMGAYVSGRHEVPPAKPNDPLSGPVPYLGVQAVEVHPEHQHRGLGRAMYLAAMAHSYHKHGARWMAGDEHSPSASRVHQSIARDYHVDYRPGKATFPKTYGREFKGYKGDYAYSLGKALDDDFDSRLRADWKRVAPKSVMRSPAFRHVKTGKVVESPVFHDAAVLPGEEDKVWTGQWEDGFVDHHGKFYNRHQAARAVGAPASREDFGLETQAYLSGRKEGLYKTEPMMRPAFYHRPSQKSYVTPVFHDSDHLRQQLVAEGWDPDEGWFPHEAPKGPWVHGFVDQSGKFYTRRAANAAVGNSDPGDQRYGLESQKYTDDHAQGLVKAESTPAFERPHWVEPPELPQRIQRIYDAIRSNLSPDLLGKDSSGRDWNDPKVRGSAHPLAGHCYVATEALWHLLDGKRTGWERMHLPSKEGPHWFLQHKKTGVILDPTAEQYDERPPYENARAKGFSVGPPDYDPTKPSKRAQQLIDRVKPALRKAEVEDTFQELAKTVGYITFPKMGITSAQEPMTYPKGSGFMASSKKGRAIFGARNQLAADPRSETKVDDAGNVQHGVIEGGSAGARRRQAGANMAERVQERGGGWWSRGAEPGSWTGDMPMPPEQRVATGFAIGGQAHGLVGTRAHEAQHSVFGQLSQKYGDQTRQTALQQLISKLTPEGRAAGERVMKTSGYSLGLDPEEFVTSHQQFLTDARSRANIYRALGLEDEVEQWNFFKLMRQNFEQMRQYAASMKPPRGVKVPRVKKLRKSEGELRKSIAAIPQGKMLAHNPRTNESLHDFSHVLPPQLQAEGWRLRIHHFPRIDSMTAHLHAPDGKGVGSLTSYHSIENGEPVLGIDTANLKPEHRGKGLGKALYEATYAFGFHNLKLRKVVGQEHSKEASRVHRALAQKHGLHYEPEPFSSDGEPAAPAAGSYDYMLKSERSPGAYVNLGKVES